MPVCDVTGVCLTGGGGLPCTAADGKAHFLSRDTAEGSESFPCKEMCFSGRQREECVDRVILRKLDKIRPFNIWKTCILKDENVFYELSQSVSEGYPSRR